MGLRHGPSLGYSGYVSAWRARLLLIALMAVPGAAWAADDTAAPPSADSSDAAIVPVLPAPETAQPSESTKPGGIQWKPLFNQSFRFLLIEHAFRFATEPATRLPGRPFFRGYTDAVGALHGWADGDPFYVNYVGHPMQGAVSAYLWTLNDGRYRRVEFGRNPEYWKSRIRAGAFAWAYSEQMEIGPMSEASIGNIQAVIPQQGLVDHVVTPAIGLGWMIAEDVLDKYLVRLIEQKTPNRYVRAVVRGGANPSRSLANAIAGQWPWARPRDRGETVGVEPSVKPGDVQEVARRSGVAPFEFSADAYTLAASSGPCAGGGASAAVRINAEWQMVLDVNGCKMTGLEKNRSGDSLTYMIGPRWTPPIAGRLVPYAQVLFGGNKLTQESTVPQAAAYLDGLAKSAAPTDPSQYTQQFEHDGFAMAAGTGLDLNFHPALALRLIGVEYMRSWTEGFQDFASPNGFQVKTGIVLHMGNW